MLTTTTCTLESKQLKTNIKEIYGSCKENLHSELRGRIHSLEWMWNFYKKLLPLFNRQKIVSNKWSPASSFLFRSLSGSCGPRSLAGPWTSCRLHIAWNWLAGARGWASGWALGISCAGWRRRHVIGYISSTRGLIWLWNIKNKQNS